MTDHDRKAAYAGLLKVMLMLVVAGAFLGAAFELMR